MTKPLEPRPPASLAAVAGDLRKLSGSDDESTSRKEHLLRVAFEIGDTNPRRVTDFLVRYLLPMCLLDDRAADQRVQIHSQQLRELLKDWLDGLPDEVLRPVRTALIRRIVAHLEERGGASALYCLAGIGHRSPATIKALKSVGQRDDSDGHEAIRLFLDFGISKKERSWARQRLLETPEAQRTDAWYTAATRFHEAAWLNVLIDRAVHERHSFLGLSRLAWVGEEAPADRLLQDNVWSAIMDVVRRRDDGWPTLLFTGGLFADVIHGLRNYLEGIEFNPKRLEDVEERLDIVHSLIRKYGGNIPAVIAYGADTRKQLETISGAADRINELEMQEAKLLEKLAKQGNVLTEKRKAAALTMGKGIEVELDDLKMASARFGVDFQTKPDVNGAPMPDGTRIAFDQNGFDRIEFLIAPNPGEGLKPLAKIASGGETSRLMLGLKNVMARADEVPSLIFDEIDQGIGGRVGMVVGHKLWNLSRSHQVFCVTHLPQLAVFGDQHYQVQKLVDKGRTLTRVEHLDGEARLLELSQMLGEVGEGTLRSAHELLQTARQTIKGKK